MNSSKLIVALSVISLVAGIAQTTSAETKNASACPKITEYLTVGARRPQVIELKKFLVSEGALSGVQNTPYFGPTTEAALKAWQKKKGIVTSGAGFGVTGPKTRAALQNCTTVATTGKKQESKEHITTRKTEGNEGRLREREDGENEGDDDRRNTGNWQNTAPTTQVTPTTVVTPKPTTTTTPKPTTTVSGITVSELARHSTASDCWVAFQGSVYNITAIIPWHPGGAGAITPYCGSATSFEQAFKGQHGMGQVNNLLKRGLSKGKLI